jgi:hypothetical protein
MSIEQALLEKLRALSPDKQQELLAFAAALQQQATAPSSAPLGPRESALGLLADFGTDLSAEEIDELRRECWTMSGPDVQAHQERSTAEAKPAIPRRTIRELQIDTDVNISEEDISEARREMWGRFPREDV